ncbi:helix-turn-helix domain-containing protein [Rhizobium sp. P38BS-XIX]|uniref:AraC-like ligand-binding domain-containing protein n=1 Tax=Rhizobium sp. P38BS-XIX TaxID=2726740 RepID=UPI0014569C55|nr:helix-turn-helix domain-containing protein [Rhizobium sp. P38BS-XIX]NLR97402.1 helix-turn-helix domain-containing protein [Rhizobium sp. P38BS-XIX]
MSSTPRYMSLELQRNNTSPAERLALWQDVMGAADNVTIPDPESFTGYFTSLALGELRTMRVRSGEFRYLRDRHMARNISRDHVMVNLTVSGRISGEIAGHRVVANEGAVVISRLASPMDMVFQEGAEWLALIIPRTILDKYMSWSPRLDARVFQPQLVQAILIGGHLRSLDRLTEAISPRDTNCAARASLALLAASLGGVNPAVSKVEPTEDVVRSIRRFIAERLSDPDLGPDVICREFAMSRSKLYRVMGDNANIAGIIKRMRLRAVRSEILSDRQTSRSLAEIARSWGLIDERNFRRSFSSEFGYPPSSLRKSVGASGSPRHADLKASASDLERWFHGLDFGN